MILTVDVRPYGLGLRVLLLGLLFSVGVTAAAAASPRSDYAEAEVCYRKLKENPQAIKFRHHWQTCIRGGQAVFKDSPTGPWAAAGLYLTGNMLAELYRFSGRTSDRREALDLYSRIVKRFPKSAYKPKALKAIKELESLSAGNRSSKTVPRKTDQRVKKKTVSVKKEAQLTEKKELPQETARNLFNSANNCTKQLEKNDNRQKLRSGWKTCIDAYLTTYRYDRTGPWAAAGLYNAGLLYEQLFGYSQNPVDWQSARSLYEQVINQHAQSRYSTKSAARLMVLKANRPTAPADPSPYVAKNSSTPAPPTPISSTGPVTVTGLRHYSNPNYTRLVIDADKTTRYQYHLLRQDPTLNKPRRFYVDLLNSRLGDTVKSTIAINDDLLTDARAGQYTNNQVRVVVDIKSLQSYKIFSLPDPFRIVIDLWGKDHKGTPPVVATKKPLPPMSIPVPAPNGELDPSALAKQLALGVRRIVIDAGHGGKDYGAKGYLKKSHEKYIVLKIAQKLAQKVQSRLGAEVILTRKSDRYLTLEERTAIANTKSADLFVSIHANAAKNKNAYGIETYFLNLATDDEAILVAARENATSTKNISDLHDILTELMQNAKINESARLAGYVQSAVVSKLQKANYKNIKNKGVKQAPFYVLMGARMPAILVETSFISNPRENQRLEDAAYQDRLCDGIIDGIERYIRDTSPTALKERIGQTADVG